MAKRGFTLSTLPSIFVDKNISWGLCIGAGTSLPILPDWYSLIGSLIRKNCDNADQIDIRVYKSMGFSADSMMQAVLNKLKKTDEEFSLLLSDELYSPIKNSITKEEWKAFVQIHNCTSLASINKNSWHLFGQIIDRILKDTSANIIAQSIIQGILCGKEPEVILTFNAEAVFLALLNYYYWMAGISKKNKFDEIVNSLSTRTNDRIPYVHCHGVAPISGSKMRWGRNGIDKLVFSEDSYLNLANNSFTWQSANFIEACLHNRIVFLGVSFTDANLRRWLSSIHKCKIEDLQKNGLEDVDSNEHYWINKKPSSAVEMRWIEESVAHLGVRLIWLDDWKDCGIAMNKILGIV